MKSEVARLGGARAVGSATLAFGPKKVKSEVARLGGARAVRCFGRSTN